MQRTDSSHLAASNKAETSVEGRDPRRVRAWGQNLPVWLAAAWWGSLTTLGFFIVPMLFANLPTPAMAGNMAAKLFSAQTIISAACGLLVLLTFRSKRPLVLENTAQSATLFVVGGVLLALLVEFGVAPRIVARENLALWHAVGSGMYVGQWLCAAVVFGKLVNASAAREALPHS